MTNKKVVLDVFVGILWGSLFVEGKEMVELGASQDQKFMDWLVYCSFINKR